MRKVTYNFFKVLVIGLMMSTVVFSSTVVAKSSGGKSLRKSIAVVDFSSRVSNFEGGAGFVEMLNNALFESGRFVVLDRAALWQVLDEQDFAASDRSAKALATAMKGKVIPAQLLIIGAITEWAPGSTSAKGGGISFGGIRLNRSKSTARMGVVIRILDSSTAEVLESVSVEGEAEYTSADGGVCVSGACAGGSDMSTQSWAEVTEVVITKAVKEIVETTKKIPYRGKVIQVSGETIFANTGERNGAESGDMFSVFSPGEELIDPDTGESLGSDMSKVGSIRLISVQEKFSKAVVETGAGIQKGYIIMPAVKGNSKWD